VPMSCNLVLPVAGGQGLPSSQSVMSARRSYASIFAKLAPVPPEPRG
jgi:hypothetical protein